MCSPALLEALIAHRCSKAVLSLTLGWSIGMGVWIALYTCDTALRFSDWGVPDWGFSDWAELPFDLAVPGILQFLCMLPAALAFGIWHLRAAPPGMPMVPAALLGALVGSVTMVLWFVLVGAARRWPMSDFLQPFFVAVVGIAGLIGATTFASGAHFQRREPADGFEIRRHD
ncbi:MAG: hypothetical protein AAGB93_11910 [Planctomycetota bacterium]